MMAMAWEKPMYALLFIGIIILSYFFYRLIHWQKKALQSFADTRLRNQIFEGKETNLPRLKYIFLFLSLIFAILAMMGPMWGKEEQEIKREGISLVIALDLSTSMNAQDIAPSRLEKSKKFITTYLDKLGGDKVGLVIFAGGAYNVSPLTSDYNALNNYIEGFSTQLIWNQGTDFSKALKKSIEIFDTSPNTSKAIILISDGEDHEPEVEAATKLAKENKIQIFSVGVGSSNAVPIPMRDDYGDFYYKEDKNGNMVLTSFHETKLRSIAEKTGGKYLKLENIDKSVNDLKSEINNLEKTQSNQYFIYNKKQQFQWFLGIAILFIFIYTLTSDKLKLKF